jgi:hypothetical protein
MPANRRFVIAMVLASTAADAAPKHRKPEVVVEEDDDDDDVAPPAKPKVASLHQVVEELGADDVAPKPPAAPGWKVAIGPYVWAASVDANVSFGPLSSGVDLGFVTLARHTRYGFDAVVEARRGHLAIYGDVMYGAASVESSQDIVSVMTTLTGNAASLLIDSAVGYELLGSADKPFSIEARSGVRYQRTTVQGEIGAAGFTLATPEFVDAGADFVVGGRAAVRPAGWLQLAGAFDVGVAGKSDSTWSATVDATLHVSNSIMVSGGWRSLSMHRTNVSLDMQGPRVALQYQF